MIMKMPAKDNASDSVCMACFTLSVLFLSLNSNDAQGAFNSELVELDSLETERVDLSVFESGSYGPGTYRVDITLNDQKIETDDIEFVSIKGPGGSRKLKPCLNIGQLRRWGVNVERYPTLIMKHSPCANLQAIPQAETDFQFAALRLAISLPQAAIITPARGYISPELWDEGINAFMLNYSMSGANSRMKQGNSTLSTSQYANLRPGINIGAWRFRHYTTWSRDTSGHRSWDTVYTYAQRSIIPLNAQLVLGDSSAPADVFDSMPFRGVQLSSDEEMLPDSLKGYAPVVRGIARTHAQVMVRQNGYLIYQNYVAPGAFEITDMYPAGGAGDLDVTIREDDGRDQHYTVAYAALPVLQREGRRKYALTMGMYRSYNHSVEKTPFAQATAIAGLSSGLTLYGGGQVSPKYHAMTAGMGKNMGGIGAISADVTQSRSVLQNRRHATGQSWRVRYSKDVVSTRTHFSIAAYRYSTRGYYDMQDVLDSWGNTHAPQDRRRNRTELSMNQILGRYAGALMLSISREDYWDCDKSAASYSVGYSNAWHNMGYSLAWTYNQSGGMVSSGHKYGHDQILAINLNVPFDKFLPQTWVSHSVNIRPDNGTHHDISISGVAMENNALNWNLQQGYGSRGEGYSGSMSGDVKTRYSEIKAGYSYDPQSQRVNLGLQGGVILHSDGVTFSQPFGETNVLIKAPGAHDIGIRNQSGIKTDFRGFAVVSAISAYRKNEITLEPENMPADIELELNSQTIIPTRGAVVSADYITHVGRRVLMTLKNQHRPLPFGAILKISGDENRHFIVGDKGQVYLSGLKEKGQLTVVWGRQPSQRCIVEYQLPEQRSFGGITEMSTYCRGSTDR